MAEHTLYDYPFWGPANAGPARNFAQPTEPKSIQLDGIEADAQRLKVPQEVQYLNTFLDEWQWNPIIIPTPQAPVQTPEQFIRADSLLAYASATLATANGMAVENSQLGNAGKKNING